MNLNFGVNLIYLELKEKNVTGAYSEEFLLYMAEVSDYLAKRKKRTLIMVVSMLTVSFTILINVRTYSSQIIKKLYNLIKKKKITMFVIKRILRKNRKFITKIKTKISTTYN